MLNTISRLRAHPAEFLDPVDPLQLGAFLLGYSAVDRHAGDMIKSLASELPGPDAANAFTRAYLMYASHECSLHRLLDALEARVVASPEYGNDAAASSVMEVIGPWLAQGRPGLVMPEPSFYWLAGYSRGFVEALRGVRAPAAAIEEMKFGRLEQHLQQVNNAAAPWYRILHVFYRDHTVDGLKMFFALWQSLILDEVRGVPGQT